MRRSCIAYVVAVVAAVCLMSTADTVFAQSGAENYHPLSQHSPPGQTAAWFSQLRGYDPSWLQAIDVEIPGGGRVDVFSGSNTAVGMQDSPARFAANVGHVYRFRISSMPEFPGVEIFPSVELVDRLHPPAGREHDYAIPIIFTKEDIETAEQGQLVTRVIYLEQPQVAQIIDPLRRTIPQRVTATDNVLKEADRMGRPMAIVRIGGRRPTTGSHPSFFGTGGHVMVGRPQPVSGNAGSVSLKDPNQIQRIAFTRQQ